MNNTSSEQVIRTAYSRTGRRTDFAILFPGILRLQTVGQSILGAHHLQECHHHHAEKDAELHAGARYNNPFLLAYTTRDHDRRR